MSNNIIFEGISPHVWQYSKKDMDIEIVETSASNLIFNTLRFDLMIKYLYVKNYNLNACADWYKELYKEHMKYFNNFREDNFPERKNGEDFVKDFNKTIDYYNKTKTADPIIIPIDSDDCPIDGAHRLAIAYANNKSIQTLKLKPKTALTCYSFDYSFFRKKGLPLKYSDFVAKEYATLCENSYLLVLFPCSIVMWGQIDAKIKEQVDVYYDKEIELTELGKLNLILNLYRDEAWLGNFENNFEGANYKKSHCFAKDGGIKVYLINSSSLEKLKLLKQEIRDFCGLENHFLHSTDNQINTRELSTLFFNQNSIDFINTVELTRFSNFISQFANYKQYINKNKMDSSCFCIDGSAVLSACNLRDCYDLDFLYSRDEKELILLPEKVDCHNSYFISSQFQELLKISVSDIISNPNYHFFYHAHRVMHPLLIKTIKKYRNETKDVKDVALLSQHLSLITNVNKVLKKKQLIPPEWYPKLEDLYEEAFESGEIPKIFFNVRFFLSAKVKHLIENWNDNFDDFLPHVASTDYFYLFEFFQRFNFEIEKEKMFLDLIIPLIAELDKDFKYDYFIFCRIYYNRFPEKIEEKNLGDLNSFALKMKLIKNQV